MGYLHAPREKKPSRGEAYHQSNIPLPLPEVKRGKYLLDVLFEVGLSKSGGMGAVPIEWTDIYAYCALTATQLPRDEVLLLRRLSQAYVGQLHESREDNAHPPYADKKVGAALLFANHPNKRK